MRGQCTSTALQVAQQQLNKTIGYISTSQFPLATQPPLNHWDFNAAGDDWNSGFFPGLLWYMYEQTLDSSLLARAEAQTASLAGLTTDVNQPLGYWFMPSYGIGYSVTRNASYLQAMQIAAGTFASMWVPGAGVLNTQPTYHSGTINVIIDDLPSIELLFYAGQQTANSAWTSMALSHALKMAQNNIRADGSTYQGTEYNSDGTVAGNFTINGAGTGSTWSRGQAFGVYGFTMAYRYTGNATLLAAAQQTADYFISHLPSDFVPYWDFTQTNYKDSSAAAIAAAGLLELSADVSDPTRRAAYYSAAMSIQSFLSNSSFYLGDPSTTDGVLLHGAYYIPGNFDDDNSLIWGDYYFIQSCIRAMAAPAQVTGLTFGDVTSGQIPLSWTAQPGAIRYNVKRSLVPGGPYTVIAPPPVLTANSFNDSAVVPGTTYYYVVSASNVAGEGPNSAEIAVPTPSTSPDFTISASAGSVSVAQSGKATVTISAGALGGYSGNIVLSANSAPTGLAASFSTNPVGAGQTSLLTITAGGVPTGSYNLTVTGVAGSLTHMANVAVTVTPGGSFSIAPQPAKLALSRSTSRTASVTLTLASLNGFDGSVHLSARVPRGVATSFNPAADVTVSPSKNGVTTLTLTARSTASLGQFSVTITGTSNGLPSVTLKIPLTISR